MIRIDLNRGILTPHLSVGTHSRSTYISDLISVQDKELETAVQTLLKADAKKAVSAESATVFPVGSYVLCRYTDRPQLDYILSGMALTVLTPLRGPSTFSQVL